MVRSVCVIPLYACNPVFRFFKNHFCARHKSEIRWFGITAIVIHDCINLYLIVLLIAGITLCWFYMMINNPSEYRYSDIVDFIRENGYEVSKSSVARYAQALNASLEQVMLISNNFRLINEELAKYPDLDVSEALARLTNHKVMEAIQNLSEDSLKDVPPEKLISAVPALIKAATYKRDTDAKNRSSMDAAYDVFKEGIFTAMAKDNPQLYSQLAAYIKDKQKEGDGD